jgi:adenosine deaminase
LVAIDLAGNEAEFKTQPFLDLQRSPAGGLRLTIHAASGPWPTKEAIETLARTALGTVCASEDPAVVDWRGAGTPFEVCVTSNYQSGVIPDPACILGKMIDCGLNVTVNTG